MFKFLEISSSVGHRETKGDSALNHPLAGYSPCSKMFRRKENEYFRKSVACQREFLYHFRDLMESDDITGLAHWHCDKL